ncbi:PREDICTED: interleukin-21 receptor [Gavialis gangeticus]|uniref:interleukin-21 receptor n=1 Tax=Gavialis gangeticus TaxID=94835 RepID=UPI00092F2E65|nr:PREDICTED: interleukin-21 receptor [Gavialis gangeticus]
MRQGQPSGIVMRNVLWLPAVAFFFFLQHSASCTDLSCFVDYAETLSCFLKTNLSTTGGTSYNLTATWDKDNISWSLAELSRNSTHVQYVCYEDQTHFFTEDTFTVCVAKLAEGQHAASKSCRNFLLADSIKPSPPFNLTATFSDKYNISWETIYQHPDYYLLGDELEYELRYKKRSDPWENQRTKTIPEDKRSLVLLSLEFEAGTEYELQVRARPQASRDLYHGVWSEWSPPLRLTTSPQVAQTRGPGSGSGSGSELGSGWLLVLGIILVAAVSITLLLTKHRSLQEKMKIFIPNPAPFFKPLYMVHNGDFKKWVGVSCTKVTLDLFDWGTVLPEVLEVYSKHLSSDVPKEEKRLLRKDPPGKSCGSGLAVCGPDSLSLLSSLNSSHGTPDRSYGHLSIDTVTVADEFMPCSSQCRCHSASRGHEPLGDESAGNGEDGYPKLDLDGDGRDSSSAMVAADLSTQDKVVASGSVSMDFLQGEGVGGILGALCLHPNDWDLGSPTCLPSPGGDSTSDMEGYGFPRSERTIDGYPTICLDLDTIDSGFVDSDCGSPVDCEFERSSQTDPGSVTLDKEVSDFPRSYVKQWVSCRPATPVAGTPPG